MLMAVGTLMYVVSGLVWWNGVYLSPQRTFEDMLTNNLMVHSVTKNISLAASDGHLTQTVRLQLGATNAARWLVTAKQGDNSVSTESIGTPQTDYVRYTDIAATDKRALKQYKSVLNQWGASAAPTQTVGGLFQQALLDVNYAPALPIGYVSAESREQMSAFMQDEKIFVPDYSTVKTVTIGGRKAYQYTVSVAQAPYVRLLQSFEKSFGYNTLSDVNASQYQGQPPDTIVVAVDRLSHQLIRLSYERTGYTVTYSGYGVAEPILAPAHAIPLETLKQRLAS
jgi:hypothetical protein